jgi:hypothetical protein
LAVLEQRKDIEDIDAVVEKFRKQAGVVVQEMGNCMN